MQVKVSLGEIESIIKNSECKISHRSENHVVAFKRMNNGAIHIRFKQKTKPYLLEERSYWLADIHFEKGLRPKCYFDSPEVKDFVKEYVRPFSSSERNQ
ncbi:MAG: hypothetical protein PVH12_06255 [Candidatus Bathyarchaeota archaeon]|jgi:hypothetical protein